MEVSDSKISTVQYSQYYSYLRSVLQYWHNICSKGGKRCISHGVSEHRNFDV